MADQTEKYLIQLRAICQEISLDKDLNKNIAELRKLIKKGAFFEFHVFSELLDVLSRNSAELSKPKKREIFKLLNDLLNNESRSQETIITKLYNFIIIHKDRLDLRDELTSICSFTEKMPKSSKPDHLIYITEMLLRYSITSAHRTSLQRNFQLHFIEHGFDEDICLKLLQSTNRASCIFLFEKKFNEASEFLEETLVNAIVTNLVRAPSNDAYEELFNLMSAIAKYGNCDTKMMETGKHIAEGLNGLITKHQKRSNDLLIKIFHIFSKPIIREEELVDLRSKHYKDSTETKSGNLLYEKTTMLLAKLFSIKIASFELTPECFSSYHHLVVSIFHVFKDIKNRPGVVSCCDDIKRHEIFNLSATVFLFATKIVKTKNINKSLVHDLLYHVTYSSSICSSLKCPSKDQKKLGLYNLIYGVLYEFAKEKSMVPENIKNLHEYVRTMLNLWDEISQDQKPIRNAPDNLSWKIYDEPTSKETASYSVNGMLMIMSRKPFEDFAQSPKETKKNVLKQMCSVREAVNLFGLSTVAEFIKSKTFSLDAQQFPMAQTILFEICAIFRYYSGEKLGAIAELFSDLCNGTNDPMLLAHACQNISDELLKKIKIDDIVKINKLLETERAKSFDTDISLALALNNYNIFFVKSEEIADIMKMDKKQLITKHRLQQEIDQLKHLNESLEHLTDIVCHLVKNNGDVDKILSMKRVLNILNNMAVQYYMRGIKYKDLEAFTLLWHLTLLEDHSKNQIVLNIATFFLDNFQMLIDSSGNYVKLSKKMKQLTISEILEIANKTLDESLMPILSDQSSTVQCSVWSYLLSLCVYYMSNGKKAEGFKRWDQFLKSWRSIKTTDESANRYTVHSKIYFSMMQINMKCRNKTADQFLSIGSGILMRVKKITQDFVYHFHQIYHRITLEAINYSVNRLADMNHYDLVMVSLIASARKKGFFLKLLDLLSLSILRNLNMEKIENAKTQLKEITMLLGIEEEILIESPLKGEATYANVDYQLEENFRKSAVSLQSPLQCELSVVNQDQSEELLSQLKSFVHKSLCKCDICKISQLKFVMFQIGCHYSRLLWLMNKFEISMEFNQFALEPWRNISDKLRRLNDCEFLTMSKINFAVFSTRWLFQCADTLIRMNKFTDVGEIYQEIELVCTTSTPDYGCFMETLYVRKENLSFLLEHGSLEEEKVQEPQLSFEEFMKIKNLKKSPTTFVISKRPVPKPNLEVSKKDNVIYIDESDDELVQQKIPKTAKKPSTRAAIAQTPTPSTSRSQTAKTELATRSTRKAKLNETDSTTNPSVSTRKTRRMI